LTTTDISLIILKKWICIYECRGFKTGALNMYVYKIENKINGDFYIGKTKNSIQYRWSQHKGDHKRMYKSKLYNAFSKYGIENFEIYSIETCKNLSHLDEREIYWIEVLEPAYNIAKGGTGGWIYDQTGKTWKIKDTSRMKKPKTVTDKVIEGRKKLSGGNNYQSKFYIHTPWGIFETWKDAETEAKRLRSLGVKEVITVALRRYCMNDIILNSEGRRTPAAWRGKSTRELGFFIEEKNENAL